MAKTTRGRRRLSSQLRSSPYPLPSCRCIRGKHDKPKKKKAIKNDWEDAMCSVCMDFPHNAVLLLCSSHDKGCRPYMCGTSYRHSNCLDQFKKAYIKMENMSTDKHAMKELACPLCRGQVKGWTVVEPAREFLNMKKRSCMQDGCSFTGTYKELRKHVRADHPSAKPRQVDPALQEKWRTLEREREREDVISTIRSSMPGALVLGDYVIESGGFDSEEEWTVNGQDGNGGRSALSNRNWFQFLMLVQAMGNNGSASFASRLRRSQRSYRALLESISAGGEHASQMPASLSELPLSSSEDENEEHLEEDDEEGTFTISRLSRERDHVGVSSVRHRRRRRNRSSSHEIRLI